MDILPQDWVCSPLPAAYICLVQTLRACVSAVWLQRQPDDRISLSPWQTGGTGLYGHTFNWRICKGWGFKAMEMVLEGKQYQQPTLTNTPPDLSHTHPRAVAHTHTHSRSPLHVRRREQHRDDFTPSALY